MPNKFDELRAQTKEGMDEEFLPIRSPNMPVASDLRVAAALEYIANHIGRISKNLDRIADRLDPKA